MRKSEINCLKKHKAKMHCTALLKNLVIYIENIPTLHYLQKLRVEIQVNINTVESWKLELI